MPLALTQDELVRLRRAAEQAWDDDTRLAAYHGHPSAHAGQCYVTALWVANKVGGEVVRSGGHFAARLGDQIVDLTGNHGRPGEHTWEPYPPIHNSRTERFSARADRAFANPRQRTADMIGDAYPGEAPQAVENMNQRYMHDEPGFEPTSAEYDFVYANGQLEVSPDHDHDQLLGHAGVTPEHQGPVAVGHIVVTNGQARFEVTGNIGANALVRVLKDYAKHVGWEWGGLTDTDGWPINDAFAPGKSSSFYFGWDGEQLAISTRLRPVASKARIAGLLEFNEVDETIRVRPTRLPRYLASRREEIEADMRGIGEAVLEVAEDQGYTLLAANDNVIKTIEDLSQDNLYSPNPVQPDDIQYPARPTDERQPGGVYRCPSCEQIFPTWSLYQRHRRNEEPMGDLPDRDPNQDGGFPQPDNGEFGDGAHFTEMRQEPGITTGHVQIGHVKEAARFPQFEGHEEGDQYAVAYRHGCVVGYARIRGGLLNDLRTVDENLRWPLLSKVVRVADKAPKDLIEGPVPFIYDIQQDTIDTGQPNTRTSDIPGRFTPGGIVEGMYEPGGNVIIRTQTNQPYTVRHMLELWYHSNPMLEVKSVHLQDDAGKDTKLASNVGGYVAAMVAADPVVARVARALRDAGGSVYVVGGAVRDALLGKEPHDLDLMVRKLTAEQIRTAVNSLPGKLVGTGELSREGAKDEGHAMGVFHYREAGTEVQIALPRVERSTGPTHGDFDVDVDQNMPVGEDLVRRDFTANAMAVNVFTGELIDPLGGADDIRNGVLRTTSSASLYEDPLRVLRGVVAHAKHGLVPSEDTAWRMEDASHGIVHLPAERIRDELMKLMASDRPADGVRLAHKLGILAYVLPEVDDAFGFDQRNPHHELLLGEHCTAVLERVATVTTNPLLRLAALLHDVAKCVAGVYWQDPDPSRGLHFYHNAKLGLGQDHEEVGADMSHARLTALRFSKEDVDYVVGLVRNHMYGPFTSKRGARKFLARVGDLADDLLILRWADQGGKSIYPTNKTGSFSTDIERELIRAVREAGEATSEADLALNGHDLIEAGFKPGPKMGEILRTLTAAVIENPELNSRDALLAIARTV